MGEILGQRPNSLLGRSYSSRNVDEAIALLQALDYDLRLSPREMGEFGLLSNAAHMPKSYLGYIRYGAAVQVRVPEARKRNDYFIHLPAHGKSETENRGGRFACQRGQGVISSPAGHVMRA